MPAMISNVASEVFEILKGSGRVLSLFDVHGNKTYEPSEARRMFAEPDKLMLGITEDGSDSSVDLYLSSTTDIKNPKIGRMLNTIRTITTRYNLMYNVRKYGRELSPKDFAYQAAPMTEEAHMDLILEGMWGSTKTSYQRIGNAKLIVRHSAPVKENIIGGRGRNINALFVETKLGERFRFPVIHLTGARAFAQHLSQGGLPHDALSEHIMEMAQEARDLAHVSMHIFHNRTSLDESAMSVRGVVRERLADLRHSLAKISRERGYAQYVESFAPADETIQEGQDDSLVTECTRLQTLLGINENHALVDKLAPVARLTMGENMVSETDKGVFKRSRIAFETVESAEDLVETLASEFGYEEGAHWVREDNSFVISDANVFEDAMVYLEGLEGYSVMEEPEDKFLKYATKWTNDRLAAAGEPTLGNDTSKSAEELAQGLKLLVAGKLGVHPVIGHMPQFTDKNAEVSFKLGTLLEPKAGLKNDALYNYISSIADKLGTGAALSANEQFFAQRALALVDAAMPKKEGVDALPEMAEIEEWVNSFGQEAPVVEVEIVEDDGEWPFAEQIEYALAMVNTDDHASMVNGDDVDEAYHDIARRIADFLSTPTSDDAGDIEGGRSRDEILQTILDNWDEYTKLVNAHMGMSEGLEEMDRFSGEPNYFSDEVQGSVWSRAQDEINQFAKVNPADYDGPEDMAHAVYDDVIESLMSLYADEPEAKEYVLTIQDDIMKQVKAVLAQHSGVQEAEGEAEFGIGGEAHMNDVMDDVAKQVSRLVNHMSQEGEINPSLDTPEQIAQHIMPQLSVDPSNSHIFDANHPDFLPVVVDLVKQAIDGVAECESCDAPVTPAQDFVNDVTVQPEQDTDALSRLRKLAGI